MNIGDSVRLALRDFEAAELQASMLHACNAVDGTAKKLYSELGPASRFKKLLRENYEILEPMGFPGVNLLDTRFDVAVKSSLSSGVGVDIADVIWGIHRCTHGHGDELPKGFELVPSTPGDPFSISFRAGGGVLRLSDRIIFGMLAVAVLSPINCSQQVPEGYFLPYFHDQLPLNNLWGEKAKFLQALSEMPQLPSITMNLAGPYSDNPEGEFIV